MENYILLKMLFIIKGNGNITSLKKDGFTYGQIAKFINLLLSEEYILKDESNKIVISEKGLKKLAESKLSETGKGSNQWILPEINSKVDKLNENDVYLPRQNELFF